MTLVGIGQQCRSIENDRSSLSLRTNWSDLAPVNCTVFHHEMTALAMSAVDLENRLKKENCEALFCCDETSNLWPSRKMAFVWEKQGVMSLWNPLSACSQRAVVSPDSLHDEKKKIVLKEKPGSRGNIEWSNGSRSIISSLTNGSTCSSCRASLLVLALVNPLLFLCKVLGSWSCG